MVLPPSPSPFSAYEVKADGRMHLKLEFLRVQDLSAELATARDKADKASDAAEKHQRGVAKLTADNVVQLLRLRQCEAALATATDERDLLQHQISQKRGPWYDEVRAWPTS